MSEVVKVPRITELEEEIIKLYLGGLNRKEISLKLDLPLGIVNKAFTHKDFKAKVESLLEEKEKLMKLKMLETLDSVIDHKLENAKSPEDLINESRDILDIYSLVDKINKETEKKRLGNTGSNVIVNILQQLGGDENE